MWFFLFYSHIKPFFSIKTNTYCILVSEPNDRVGQLHVHEHKHELWNHGNVSAWLNMYLSSSISLQMKHDHLYLQCQYCRDLNIEQASQINL